MFDLVFSAADTGRLVPVYFSQPDLTISEPDMADAFAFSSTAAAVRLAESGDLTDAGTRCNGFDFKNAADNLK